MSDRVNVNTTLNKDLVNKFKKIAKEEGRHFNFYLEKGLEILLEKYNQKRKEEFFD